MGLKNTSIVPLKIHYPKVKKWMPLPSSVTSAAGGRMTRGLTVHAHSGRAIRDRNDFDKHVINSELPRAEAQVNKCLADWQESGGSEQDLSLWIGHRFFAPRARTTAHLRGKNRGKILAGLKAARKSDIRNASAPFPA